ncbi:BgtA-21271 [Blumeria graminis f. sp. tritici]|uniref:DNA polymerase epsilon subunit D n=2 Tax=Blumeria graminis f. sp. tritici TaxID=62690 RepID=A0A9X9QDP2_BLUGR|nr:hypothetical protein BGT96224_A21271 [Blumeria graminis f. sp. tritici 96224]VDB89455.1 BgtA-21271 [Blumeria graminis f. sp. tritici]
MPPRKNEVPRIPAADENVSTKEVSTAVNIESLSTCVLKLIFSQCSSHSTKWNNSHSYSGPEPPQKYCNTIGKGCPSSEYPDPEQCNVSIDEKCHNIYKLHSLTVGCFLPFQFPIRVPHLLLPQDFCYSTVQRKFHGLTTQGNRANENAAMANRKTVTPNDVLAAIDDSEFSEWRPRLEIELQKYTEMISQRKEKLQSKESDGSPRAKRLKRDGKNDEVFSGDKQEVSVSDEETSAQVDENVDEDEEDADEDHETDEQGEIEEPLETEGAVLPDLGDEALDNGDDSD